jgi:hypothetical protein
LINQKSEWLSKAGSTTASGANYLEEEMEGKLFAIHSPLNLWTKVEAKLIATKKIPTNFVD